MNHDQSECLPYLNNLNLKTFTVLKKITLLTITWLGTWTSVVIYKYIQITVATTGCGTSGAA